MRLLSILYNDSVTNDPTTYTRKEKSMYKDHNFQNFFFIM